MGSVDLRIDIFGAPNDCRIFRLIGLVRLDCQKKEMEDAGREFTIGEN